MQTTGNLGLKKPDGTDVVNIDDLNYNADVLDIEVVKRVINAGSTPSIQAGLDANKPAAGTAGRLYVATDTQIIYRDTGTAWQKVGVVKWGDIEEKPSSFPPSAHSHAGSDITSAVANATNADTVDGAHAGTGANNVLKLDSSGLVPLANIPATLTGKNADQVDGYHAGNASGQIPISNGTVNTNLNADKLDGYDANTGTTANTIPVRNASGQVPGDITGNAATATKLQTARTISLSGDVTGSASFDGSANASISATLANSGVTAGTYRQVTVDAKGRVTAGSNPTTLAGYGITDAASAADLAAHLADIVTVATPNKILKLNADGKLPADITGSAAKLGGLTPDKFAQVLSGSYKIQNGAFTINATQNIWITGSPVVFPVAFDSVPLVFMQSSNLGFDVMVTFGGATTTTQFIPQVYNRSATATLTIYWLAIGV